jgi:hypothetical protein
MQAGHLGLERLLAAQRRHQRIAAGVKPDFITPQATLMIS